MAGTGVARDNLRLGHVVVADCVNDVNITRDAWRNVALGVEAPVVEIEIVCSDVTEHRRRVETPTLRRSRFEAPVMGGDL